MSASSVRNHDERHSALIERLERERREEREREIVESRVKSEEIANLKLKLDASVARIKILEKATADSKAKMQILLDKSANDDKLIDALKAELDSTRKQLRENLKKAEQTSRTSTASSLAPGGGADDDSRQQLEELRRSMQTQSQLLKYKDDQIKQLQRELLATTAKQQT